VHRDIKPENLLLDDATGALLIADFGLVLALTGAEGGGPVSQSGTPDFAAPEQLMSEHVDGRTDLYSLTLAAYYALTGELPFGAGTVESVLARQTAGRLPNLVALRPDVPVAVARVLAKGAAQSPQERWTTAEEYARALEDAAGSAGGPIVRFLRSLVNPR
jgi:serine/threonine-protein kinase